MVLMVVSALQRKRVVLTLLQQRQNFASVYVTVGITVICCLWEKYKFKADYENTNFPTQFCLGSLSEKFDKVESSELSF